MSPSNSPLLLPLLLVLLLLPLLATAQRQQQQRGGRAQWFLTGRESHPQQDRSFSLFRPQGDTRSTQGWTWADPDPDLEVDQDLGVDMEGNHSEMGLAFGGALWRLEARGQGEAGARLLGVRGRRFLATVLQLPEEEQEQEQEAEGPSGVGSVVSQVHSYGIFVTKDYEHPYGLEIGLMEEFSREFSQRKIHELRLGKELRIVVRMPATGDLPETEHHIVIAEDIRERLSLTQHTWHSVYSPPLSLPPSSTATPISHNPDYNVRLMTYNIWHNNPPTWVVSSSQRTAWYDERLALLTHYINQEDPDIITFQEVRLDSSFPHEFKPETSPAAAPGEKENGNEGIADRGPGSLPREALETIGSRPGSQMHHLLDALQQRIASYSEVDGDDGCNDVLCKYQLVYQPAMSMHDRNKPFERNEEGVAMLVRATSRQRNSSKLKKNENEFRLEVSRVQPLFLGRDMDNKMDDHHRVILHAEVRLVPVTSTPETATVFPVIDVMTTHLSLSSPARVQSMEAVWHFSAIATDKDNGEAFGTHMAPPPPPKHSSLVEEVEVSVSGDTIVSDNEVATDTASSIGFTRGNVQIVTGDFNAEPHEPAYRFITGQLPPVVDPVPEGVEGTIPSQCHPDFQDAWVVGGDEESESDGYTFPSCNPVKRIDFILVRNSSSTKCFKSTDNGDWKATIEHTRRVGLEPTTETADRVGAREGLGMLDHDSPIWASDHFALVTDLRLYQHD